MIRRRGLGDDRRGAVTALVAGGMVMFLGLTAFAVDLGSAYLDSRRLQGVADAAALAAAADLAGAERAAGDTVRANRWPTPVTTLVQRGAYARDVGVALDGRFDAAAATPDAVRVTLTAQTPLWFAGVLVGRRSMTIVRRATAARSAQAAFSLGTRLASVQGGVANAVTSALLGGTVSLSAADYRALILADVDVLRLGDALRSANGMTGQSYGEVLARPVTLAAMLTAAATALAAGGQAEAAALMRTLAAAAAARTITPATLIDPGPYTRQTGANGATIAVSAWDLAQVSMQLGAQAAVRRDAAIDLGIGVPGLGATKLWFATGERAANSPWLTVTAAGTPVLRTAQTRLYVETTVGVSGLGAVTALKLPLFVELGEATASLAALDCASGPAASATLAVTPALGHASIAQVATAGLSSFTTPVTEGAATLAAVTLPFVGTVTSIQAAARVDFGGTVAQSVRFTRADVTAGTVKAVSTGDLATGIAASLLGRTSVSGTLLGLPISLGNIGVVTAALTGVAAPLDVLIDGVTGLIGLHVGQADVRVNGLRCGQAVLVA